MGRYPGHRGIEAEGWLSKIGHRAPAMLDGRLLEQLMDVNGSPNPFKVERESGVGAIEGISIPASSIAGAVGHIKAFDRRVAAAGYAVTYTCRSPFDVSGAETLLTHKSRFAAIVEAAQHETRALGRSDDWRGLLDQNKFAATHLHRSFDGFRLDSEGVDYRLLFVANIINNFGPRIAKIICAMCGVSNAGHLAIFDRWAARERFSRYGMWYRSFEDLKAQVAALTRFVKLIDGDKESGKWAEDLQTPLDWAADEDVNLLGMWHLCRLRKKYGTAEVRILPSLPLGELERALTALDDFLTFIVDVAAPGDVDIEGPGELTARPVWRDISNFRIGGYAAIPGTYSAEDWLADIRN